MLGAILASVQAPVQPRQELTFHKDPRQEVGPSREPRDSYPMSKDFFGGGSSLMQVRDPLALERAARLYRSAASVCAASCTWSGRDWLHITSFQATGEL